MKTRYRRIFITAILAIIVAAVAFVLFLRHSYVVPVLMYHSVDYNDKTTKLSVSPESFERQMKFLHDRRYNVVGLDRVVSYIEKKEKVPFKTVAITFDDGFENNYKYAYPVLKKYNLPATIFVITEKIGNPGWVNWVELKEMSDSGLITIGSHTVSHRWLPSYNDKELNAELKESKAVLERGLGKSIETFCYPIGAFDDRVKSAVKGAGYACAVGTNPGRLRSASDPYAIKRVRISRTSDNLFVFWIESSGYYTWIKERRDE